MSAVLHPIESTGKHVLSDALEQNLKLATKGENGAEKWLRVFFESYGIQDAEQITYWMRCRFNQMLQTEKMSLKRKKTLVAILDRIKIEQTKQVGLVMKPFSPEQSFFRQDFLFLLYIPDYETAVSFRQAKQKNKLFWDLTRIPWEALRNQVRMLLCEILNQYPLQSIRGRYLEPLRALIDFCIEHKIDNLMLLEKEEENRFYLYVQSKSFLRYASGTVEFCRKTLFLKQKDVPWEALVWYLDRFSLPEQRRNESCPIRSFDFLEIKNRKNRRRMQDYVRYLIGISDLSLKAIQVQIFAIRRALVYLDQLSIDLEQVTFREWEEYFLALGRTELKRTSYNRVVQHVSFFLHFLRMKGYAVQELNKNMFLQKVHAEHNDRIVPEETIIKILKELPTFPEHLQMMYLILFCTGLRKSEVCMLKGNAAFYASGESWLQVYQTKMKRTKVIPVPKMLVQLMQEYQQKHEIRSEEYLFQSQNGDAFRAVTFSNQMIKECKTRGIDCGDYIFRAHDYRHVLATRLYQSGVSLQGVRSYMGHRSDNMTKQYLDAMPKRIVEKTKAYYQKSEPFRLD